VSNLIPIVLNGMDNKSRPENIKPGMGRIAINVQFSNTGEIRFPRPGKTSKYSGDCEWLYEGKNVTLFVEGGSLKKLNTDNTATVIKSGIGSSRVDYTVVGTDIYWSNGFTSGIVDSDGINREWGTEAPPRQPDCTPITFGGLFAGDYRIAITWLGTKGAESPTGKGVRITVQEGGGIRVSNFPVPPAYVTGVALFVSSVNSKDMYLYGEYSATINDVTLTARICTIPLATQNTWVPKPMDVICAHYGRIYYAVGPLLYYTEIMRYGIQAANSYYQFDSDFQVVVSTPNVLYVGTLNKLYKLSNIDGDGPTIVEELQNCGAVKGSVCYHKNGVSAYCMSDRGFLEFRPEGVKELSFDTVAIDFYESGTTTITERDGEIHLVFVGQGRTINQLANSSYIASESLRLGY